MTLPKLARGAPRLVYGNPVSAFAKTSFVDPHRERGSIPLSSVDVRSVQAFIRYPWLFHVLFWTVVFGCYLSNQWSDFLHPMGALATCTTLVAVQVVITYVFLALLQPYMSQGGSWIVTGMSLLLLTFVGHGLLTTVKFFYLEPAFPHGFRYCLENHGSYTFLERIFDLRYAYLVSAVDLYVPTLVMVAIQHYRRQHRASSLQEELKRAELNALKNQLNPHFLFNTLNNLYALALKKSDAAPEAIAKLSDILDHILYRCEAPLVSLAAELALLRSYVSLEQLRYGKRVAVHLTCELSHPQHVPPLLLLTLLENAFKHGVSQETDQATIRLELTSTEAEVNFRLSNTIPAHRVHASSGSGGIGLTNIRKQLDLLYPNRHALSVQEADGLHVVHLRLLSPAPAAERSVAPVLT